MAGKGENADGKSAQPNVDRVESAVRESSTTFISELESITGPSGSGRMAFSQLEREGYSARAEALEGSRILDTVKGSIQRHLPFQSNELSKADIQCYLGDLTISDGEKVLAQGLLRDFDSISSDPRKATITPGDLDRLATTEKQHSDFRNLYASSPQGKSLYDRLSDGSGGISGTKLDAMISDPSLSPQDRDSLQAVNQLRQSGWLGHYGDVTADVLKSAISKAGLTAPSQNPHDAIDYKIEPTGAKLYELHGLEHRTGDYKSPDAMVLLPKDFDASKPVHLIVYDHGWYDTAKTAYEKAHLAEQMAKAPPNTVLVVPEWQKFPGSSEKAGGDQGAFANQDFMSGMVQDIFKRTPELSGKTLADIDRIGIISHSAGFHAAESELYKNSALASKVSSVTLLDSLYDQHGFDKWLQSNLGNLNDGAVKFNNVFTSGTAEASKAQAELLKKMLKASGFASDSVDTDYKHDSETPGSDLFANHSLVFRSTAEEHMAIPDDYPGIVLAGS